MRRNSAEVADVKVIAHPASALVPEPSPADPPNSRILVIDDAQAIHDDFRKILVEDDEPVRSLTRRLLENFGYRVREAASGREARAKWKGESAETDLLLSDILMPQGVSGLDLAARLRAQRPALKVVFMSGCPAEAAGKDTTVFRQPRTRFLQKTSPWRDLLRAVRQCLDEE
jgi:CheY-like chemotaxis protein